MIVSESIIGQPAAPLDPVEITYPESERSVDSGVPAPATEPATGRVGPRGRLLAVPGAALLLVWMYALTVHANSTAVNSDGATVILQGSAVASGNVLLHGWILSLDSWWTLDVAFYALITSVTGVHGYLLLAGPALIAGLVVIVGAVIARRGRRGSAATAGMATVVAVLALPSHTLATYLMCGPIHVSTALFALVAFLGLRRNHIGWGWLMAVFLLAAGMLGDLQMVSYGVVPVLLAGCAASSASTFDPGRQRSSLRRRLRGGGGTGGQSTGRGPGWLHPRSDEQDGVGPPDARERHPPGADPGSAPRRG